MLDRYGRLYELPSQLARMGHEVRAWCMDYRGHHDEQSQHAAEPGTLAWTSYALDGIRIVRLAAYPRRLRTQLADFKPQLLIGASDIPHTALAAWLGDQLGVPCVVDLYDNFESFGQAQIPGFRALLRYAIRKASLVITVSQALREKVINDYAPTHPVVVMPNGINSTTFFPGDRVLARQALRLPPDARLVGTAGGLSRLKGVSTIYAAWPQMELAYPNLHLVLAGPVEKDLPIPTGPRVHYLGELPESQVAELFRALDVGIISLTDSPFGRYCFPQKTYEMLACHLPIVVTNIGEMGSLFAPWPRILFSSGNTRELIIAVQRQLEGPIKPAIPILDWHKLVAKIEPALKCLPEH